MKRARTDANALEPVDIASLQETHRENIVLAKKREKSRALRMRLFAVWNNAIKEQMNVVAKTSTKNTAALVVLRGNELARLAESQCGYIPGKADFDEFATLFRASNPSTMLTLDAEHRIGCNCDSKSTATVCAATVNVSWKWKRRDSSESSSSDSDSDSA